MKSKVCVVLAVCAVLALVCGGCVKSEPEKIMNAPGAAVRVEDWTITLNSAKTADNVPGQELLYGPGASNVYVIANFSVQNHASETRVAYPLADVRQGMRMQLIYDNERTYESTYVPNYTAGIYDLPVSPNTSIKGDVIFTVPKSSEWGKMELHCIVHGGLERLWFSLPAKV
jgi:hypothetical protein